MINFLKKLYKFARQRFYVNETLILFSHNKYNEMSSPAVIKYATESNLSDILTFQNRRYVDVFEKFLNTGDSGYFAYVDGLCVHRSWVKHTPQTVNLHWALPMELKRNEAFIHYCETAPSARGMNIYPAVLSRICNDFREKASIMISCNVKNSSSIRGIEKAGFVERESSGTDYNEHQADKGLKIIMITMGISDIVKPLLVSHHKIVGIIECAPRNFTKRKSVRQRFYDMAKSGYSKLRKQPLHLENIARSHNIPYYYMNNGSDSNLQKWVHGLGSDLIVVHSMSQLLKTNIFTIPRFGTINLHPSLLPSYRGSNPWFWMYYNMDLSPGVTVHYIDEGEDTGDIIYQEAFDISLGTRFLKLRNYAIQKIGVPLLLKSIDAIANGIAPRIQQPAKSPTERARNISKNEAIIAWDEWGVKRIWHILRGTSQWLNAIPQPNGVYSGQHWDIEEYESCNMYDCKPGRIYRDGNRTFVACRDGKIYLKAKFNLKRFLLNFVR